MAIELNRHRNATRRTAQRQYVLFRVDDAFYCLPIELVREILIPQSIIKVPHAPIGIIGVSYYHGVVVPILDLRTQFEIAPLADTRGQKRVKWIMAIVGTTANMSSKLITLVVDQVHHVFTTSELPKPTPSLGGGENMRGVSSVLSGTAAGIDPSLVVFVVDTTHFYHFIEPTHPNEGSAS